MDEDKLKEISKKQEETFTLVKKLWKAEKWRRYFSVIKYVFLIGIAFGAFYFLTPYLERLITIVQQFREIDTLQDLQKLLEQTGK